MFSGPGSERLMGQTQTAQAARPGEGGGAVARAAGTFATFDAYVQVLLLTPRMRRAFLGLLCVSDGAAGPGDGELPPETLRRAQAWFAHQTSSEALELLRAHGVACLALRGGPRA